MFKHTASTRPFAFCIVFALGLFAPIAHGEDIDIFTSSSAGTAAAPNIMFMVDNSANWARASQKWPSTSGNQGESELLAIKNVLSSMNATTPLNLGLAMYTQSGSQYGGTVRFGARDMTVAENKTAFSNILDGIRADVNSSKEKVAQNEGETAALYELFKYFKSGAVFRGGLQSGNDPAASLDVSGNTGGNRPFTTVGQGLTSGFAVSGGSYVPPVSSRSSCGGSNYVILVANNANGGYPLGDSSYQGVSAGTSISGTTASWTDEWARYLYRSGISVYVLDAYNAQNNAAYSSVLKSAAKNGGGKYFQVGSQTDIETALKAIFAEILSVNTTFAAASLPISATNRSQSLNQVFIGMFRPDQKAAPRWMGNLKRYQLVNNNGSIDLGDVNGANAVNLQTGFVAECTASYWTKDTGSYWGDVPIDPVPSSMCTSFPSVDGITGSSFSDLPDGPRVEKGGVAEVLRQGNNPPTTYTTPTFVPNRTIWTHDAATPSTLVALNTTSTGLASDLVDWIRGAEDVAVGVEKVSNTAGKTRPSIHGDVVHSRPLPVNYGASGVTVYYGSNDGMFRAVDASTGKERWAFVSPEAHSKFARQRANSPLINYPTLASGITPTPTSKDYFFDGSAGIFQNSDNSKVWIYPTMRRGGRFIYGFDVTNANSPSVKWRAGCPNASNDTGCSTGMSGMGQSWSTPSVAFISSVSRTTPVLIVGGGYDACEDGNSTTPTCTGRKGNVVYVLNGDTGAVLASFTTAGSVAADISLADTNNDGSVDYGYVVDTLGNIYRIDFSTSAGVSLPPTGWGMRKIAYSSGGGRKFLYAPALFANSGKMYVALGSGDREHPLATHYPYANTVTNRLYVYLDDLSVLASSTDAATALDTDTGIQNFTSTTSCTTAGVTPSSGKKGWYMDLTGRGEQTVTTALIAGGLVTFNTNRATPSTNSCSASLGEARGYWVNLTNASGAIGSNTTSCGQDRSSVFAGGGLTPAPTLATVLIGTTLTTVAIGAVQRSGGASSGIAPQKIVPSIASKRRIVYWKSDAGSK